MELLGFILRGALIAAAVVIAVYLYIDGVNHGDWGGR